MPASGVYFLDVAGRVILSRDYRGDVPLAVVDRLVHHLGELEEQGQLAPVVHFKGFSFVYTQYSNLYVVAAATANANAAALLLFLHKTIGVFKEYFGDLEEESLRDNFVIIYELLDEIMDFGYPQFTEGQILQARRPPPPPRSALAPPPRARPPADSGAAVLGAGPNPGPPRPAPPTRRSTSRRTRTSSRAW